ncbi:hypothetical protein EDC01DRAFT_779180 [Geopyxis carbonaria]|nr:hypothetical protein EDC01DRAFT_779180 [Geopyxis carbonaria]
MRTKGIPFKWAGSRHLPRSDHRPSAPSNPATATTAATAAPCSNAPANVPAKVPANPGTISGPAPGNPATTTTSSSAGPPAILSAAPSACFTHNCSSTWTVCYACTAWTDDRLTTATWLMQEKAYHARVGRRRVRAVARLAAARLRSDAKRRARLAVRERILRGEVEVIEIDD